MFKLTGFLMLVISGSLCGYTASRNISERVKFLEEYLEFISSTETQIRYTCTPMSEIIKKHTGKSMFCSFIKQCCEYISSGIPFPNAWTKSLNTYKKEINLQNKAYMLINSFGKGLGASDIEGQITHCEYHKQAIKPYLENELENKKNKSKMYAILGTSLGTIIGLIII